MTSPAPVSEINSLRVRLEERQPLPQPPSQSHCGSDRQMEEVGLGPHSHSPQHWEKAALRASSQSLAGGLQPPSLRQKGQPSDKKEGCEQIDANKYAQPAELPNFNP